MKRSAIVIGVVVLALAGAAIALRAGRTSSGKHQRAVDPTAGLGVEELMHQPDSHPGRVRVEGVVASVEAENHLVTLIDKKEWDECGEVNCASLSLPVRWTGEMPRAEEGVAVTGHIEEQSGKLVFVAEAVDRVPIASASGK